MGGEERLENLRGDLGRNAGPAIDHLDQRRPFFRRQPWHHRYSRRLAGQASVAQRILHQIPHHLLHLLRIGQRLDVAGLNHGAQLILTDVVAGFILFHKVLHPL